MKLCPHCMRPAEGENQAFCTSCGGSMRYENGENLLPVGTVLTGSGGLRTYQIGAVRGQGGFGITYIALETASRKRVAIKEYFPTRCAYRGGDKASVLPTTGQRDAFQGGLASFLDEAKMLAAHDDLPSVVRVIDYFQANNTAYLVMEYLEGVPLHEQMAKSGGRLSGQELMGKLPALLRDLGQLHRSGVIHRDISPDNIMWMPDGTLKLLDFGCARSMEGGRSMTVLLKHGFAPIEQYRTRGQGPYTDVYALAATVYYAITGQVPPSAMDRLEQDSLQSPIALGADITVQQETGLLWALSVQPQARPQSMDELAGMLFKEEPAPPPPPPPPPPTKPTLLERLKNLNGKAKAGIGIGAAAAVLLTVIAVWQAGDSVEKKSAYTPPPAPVTSKPVASPSHSVSLPPAKESEPVEPVKLVTGDGYLYEIVDKTTVTLTGFEGNGIVPLPEKVEGLPVTAIGTGAFAGIPMDSVSLPAGLKTVGANAFRGCTGLKQVTASSDVSCDTTTFSGCSNLRCILVKDGCATDGWKGLPSGCRVFREGMDVGVGALSGWDIVVGSAKELYGLTADGKGVLLDVPANVTRLVVPSQVTFGKSKAAVTWIDAGALKNASDGLEIELSEGCYFPFELVSQADWTADWRTFTYEWIVTCEAAQAVNDARPSDAPRIEPNEGAMQAAVLRLSELFKVYDGDRPDGTRFSSALTEKGVQWNYTRALRGRNSTSAQDARDRAISDAAEDLAPAITGNETYAGRYWTQIGVAVSSPDGENFYRYIFGIVP